MSPLSEEVLNYHAIGHLVQNLPSSSLYPSQISSPLTDGAWPLNEVESLDPSLQWPEILLNNAETYFLDDEFMLFQGQALSELPVQDQQERENSTYPHPIFNRESSIPNSPWSPVDPLRYVNLMPRDLLLTERAKPRNAELSDEVSRGVDETVFNAQVIPSERNQATPLEKLMAPTTSSDHSWEHMVVFEGNFQQLNEKRIPKETKKKTGRRTGPLPTESKRKAGQIRQTGACWRCWSLHLSVSSITSVVFIPKH
jgi:hypothetical protein